MKKQPDMYIVRCEAKPRCGSGQVLLRCSYEAAIKTAKDHAAGHRKHEAVVLSVSAYPTFRAKPAEMEKEGYKFKPTREYDYGGDYL
jgi:hypothetical protein